MQDDVLRLNHSMTEVKLTQEASLADQKQGKILRWLSALDPSSSHNSARKKQQETTGAWFLDSPQYAKWKTSQKSFLWLHGIREYTLSSVA